MTLHWWMHWFWVTVQIVVSLTVPTTEGTTTAGPGLVSTESSYPGLESARMQQTTETLQQDYRVAKPIGVQSTTGAPDSSSESLRQAVTTDSPTPRNLQFARFVTATTTSYDRLRSTSSPLTNRTSFEVSENKTGPVSGRIPGKKESKITWVQAFSKAPKLKYEEKTSSMTLPSSSEPAPEDLTVMPLQEAVEEAKPKSLDPHAIRREQQQPQPSSSVGNRSADGGSLAEENAEPPAIATAASVLEAGLGDSTRLGRARGTFTSEFHQEHRSENQEEAIKETAETSANVTEIATITGSCLAIIVLLSTVGSLGFIMYRRRYLNPPQTLNSDKCSNPDSSGYIDDSTIRENSEEMYSLDNDSFLNSLEAMTIQNYWTDSVKHTKL